jgi:hypothetical protein
MPRLLPIVQSGRAQGDASRDAGNSFFWRRAEPDPGRGVERFQVLLLRRGERWRRRKRANIIEIAFSGGRGGELERAARRR